MGLIEPPTRPPMTPTINPETLTADQARELIRLSIETVYLDGVNEVIEYFKDVERNVLWGSFPDEEKVFDFENNLTTNELTY
ncbi:hypothetical protein [Neosynechococcus sphagnicola]|uniref:hypothetical protein n=1 Tax=Neosynechococcus sphagnicola TaxID=1501145 RepID=UPI0012E0B76B|nr:hypothetical protein [Neosynechococcus sphagnicola]